MFDEELRLHKLLAGKDCIKLGISFKCCVTRTNFKVVSVGDLF